MQTLLNNDKISTQSTNDLLERRIGMDNELKELAALALRNAFWHDFSALVNKYLEAAEGLDVAQQEMQMGDMTGIYGRGTEEVGDVSLNIWTQNGNSEFATTGHKSIVAALEHKAATEVHLRGEKVFEKRDGEWYFTG